MIKPTVGRIVWYYSYYEGITKPMAAIIADVWSDTVVNLTVFNPSGVVSGRLGVPLVQDEKDANKSDIRGYCTWMPYQKGQAAKTEALEKELAKNEWKNG